MNGDDCPVCLSYSEDTERKLDRAGRAHEQAMAEIRSVEQAGVGWSAAMSITIGTAAFLEVEARRTAEALGF